MLRLLVPFLAFAVSSPALESEVPGARLPKGTAKVMAVLYDHTADSSRPSVVSDGVIHPGVIKQYSKILSDKDVASLLDALTEKHPEKNRFLCEFAPRHGLIFYDKSDAILGHVSICFACSELKSPDFRRSKSEFHSYWDWEGLKDVFNRNRIPVFKDSRKYTDLRSE